MTRPTPPDGYIIEPLDPKRHRRDDFICGTDPEDKALEEYLKTRAGQAQSRLTAGTHVLLESPTAGDEGELPIVGFLTLTMQSIPLADYPAKFRSIAVKDAVMSMLLARMAVHTAHRGRGLGKFLLQYTFACAAEQASISGCPVIVVDPKPKATTFYPKFGFEPFPNNSARMFIATATAEKLL